MTNREVLQWYKASISIATMYHSFVRCQSIADIMSFKTICIYNFGTKRECGANIVTTVKLIVFCSFFNPCQLKRWSMQFTE